MFGSRGLRQRIGGLAQDLAGRGADFQRIVTEHNKNALRWCPEWRKSKLQILCHGRCPLARAGAFLFNCCDPARTLRMASPYRVHLIRSRAPHPALPRAREGTTGVAAPRAPKPRSITAS